MSNQYMKQQTAILIAHPVLMIPHTVRLKKKEESSLSFLFTNLRLSLELFLWLLLSTSFWVFLYFFSSLNIAIASNILLGNLPFLHCKTYVFNYADITSFTYLIKLTGPNCEPYGTPEFFYRIHKN